MKQLVIEPEAELDITDAFEWYETQHPGLGNRFLKQISVELQTILERPTSFPTIKSSFRRCIVHQFPYLVIFRSSRNAILILGVIHSSRDPGNVHKRFR